MFSTLDFETSRGVATAFLGLVTTPKNSACSTAFES